MLEINNQYTLMKRRIDTEVLKAFFAGNLKDIVDTLPIKIIPRDRDPNRCCVYKERAMVRYRIMALLGVNIERDDDEFKPLSEYVEEALQSHHEVFPTLTTIGPGCSSCPDEQYRITDACRGCFARPCLANCPKDAIVFVNGRAQIVEDRCVKCGKCMDVCPFHAVAHIPVPCEAVCPVDAIHKNEEGIVEIDHEKCISCGHCARSCPFGAIAERSSLIDIARFIKEKIPMTAMIAPAIEGQFPGTLAQIHSALLALGFSDVVEVAQGAHITAEHEAHEVSEKIASGASFMTTSCCPAYMELIHKHVPFLENHRSSALSPMVYTAIACAEQHPERKRIFIGPCLAKKVEAASVKEIDGVITFAELAALFISQNIDVKEMEETPFEDASKYSDCREFACPQGVAHSVLRRGDPSTKVMNIDGVDKKSVRVMKSWEKRPCDASLVEVMCCEGGCLAGPGVLVNPKIAMRLRQGAKVTSVGAVPLKGTKRGA